MPVRVRRSKVVLGRSIFGSHIDSSIFAPILIQFSFAQFLIVCVCSTKLLENGIDGSRTWTSSCARLRSDTSPVNKSSAQKRNNTPVFALKTYNNDNCVYSTIEMNTIQTHRPRQRKAATAPPTITSWPLTNVFCQRHITFSVI